MSTLFAEPTGRLVPGDVDGLEELSRRFTGLAQGCSVAADTVRLLETSGWEGSAAAAFRGRREEVPSALSLASVVFGLVGRVLRDVAVEVEDARRLARQAQDRWYEADAASRAWASEQRAWEAAGRPAGPLLAPPAQDPGDAERRAAERMLDAAQDRVHRATTHAATVVRRAAEVAPTGPSWGERALHGFGVGVAEATLALAEDVWASTDAAWSLDPRGVQEHRREAAAGVVAAVQDPVAGLVALLDLRTWRDDPARAAGRLVPDVVLTALTGGLGLGGVLSRRAGDLRLPEAWDGPYGEHLTAEENAAVEAWHAEAVKAESAVTPWLQDLVDGVSGGRLAGLEHRVKELDSLRGKVAPQLAAARQRVEDVLHRVRDGVRYTVVASTDDYVSVTRRTYDALLTGGARPLTAPRVSWSDPEHYSGVNTWWVHPLTPWPFEVQFHTPESLEAKEAEHPLYEEKRRLTSTHPRYAELDREGRDTYRRVPRPLGIDGLRLEEAP